MEKEQNKIDRIFENLSNEFGMNPSATHNRPLLLELEKLSVLEEIRALLIDVKGKIKTA